MPDETGLALLSWVAGLAVGGLIGLGAGLASAAGGKDPRAVPSASAIAARHPYEIPARGWSRIIGRTIKEFSEDRIPAVAASVTFFALLSLFPAIGVFASLYGLFADVEDARRQVASLAGLLPGGAVSVIGDQMTRLASLDHRRLGVTFALSLVLSLWTSNSALKALIAGLNITYEVRERRKFIRLNLVSLGLTAGAVFAMVIGMAAVAAVPALFETLGVSGLGVLALLRWPAVMLVVLALLSVLYRYGPCRPHARWRWVNLGGAVAAAGWMIMSLLFSWYVANFGHYNRTYGSLGAIVGFMTWIWLSMIVVLFGAELNAEIEAQTSVDTTTDSARPTAHRR